MIQREKVVRVVMCWFNFGFIGVVREFTDYGQHASRLFHMRYETEPLTLEILNT